MRSTLCSPESTVPNGFTDEQSLILGSAIDSNTTTPVKTLGLQQGGGYSLFFGRHQPVSSLDAEFTFPEASDQNLGSSVTVVGASAAISLTERLIDGSAASHPVKDVNKPSRPLAKTSMISTELPSPGLSGGSRTSHFASTASQYESDLSTISGDEKRGDARATEHSNGQGKAKWLSQVKRWLSASEPSAKAMKQQKRDAYLKHNIDPKDPRAAAKMHIPFGRVPAGATTSTTGPSPEKALMAAAKERRNRLELIGHSHTLHSRSSELSSAPSVKDSKYVAGW